MKKVNILVFPCGSEVALEIYRSLRYSSHFKIIGASSIDDHGKYVYENYIGEVPFINDKNFISHMQTLVKENNIHAIFPAMDLVAFILKENEKELNCKVISSSVLTNKICSSKAITYEVMKEIIPTPDLYNNTQDGIFPLFIKPAVGYGSRNTFKAENKSQADSFLEKQINSSDFLLCELLTGSEYTIDCFTDRHGQVRYSKARKRNRVSNGISVNTYHDTINNELFESYAKKINSKLVFRGAWFFQLKEDKDQKLKLLEIATRLAGSSAIFRAKGINFALLSVYDFLGYEVDLFENNYSVEMDRALSNRYKIDCKFDHVYVDLDDCLIVNGKTNIQLISFLYKALNENIKINLITKHQYELEYTLNKYRLTNIFDFIIHIGPYEKKSDFIKTKNAIFIDDSFQERKQVFDVCNIPVFSPDMVEALL